MKSIVSLLLLLILASLLPWVTPAVSVGQPPGPTGTPSQSYESIRSTAEALIARKSYEKAHETYRKALDLKLKEEEARWVEFRLADTLWRSQAATQSSDTSLIESAEKRLQELIRRESGDRTAAEAYVSLGDYFWTRRESRNWYQAWPYYEKALDYWAGSRDLERARAAYLNIVFSISLPAWQDQGYYYGNYGNYLPVPVLQNALNLARNAAEIARCQYLLATTLAVQGNWPQKRLASRHFEAALEAGREFEWYDDALFRYAQFAGQSGKIYLSENGQWRQEPDFPRAVELYRKLTREFTKGETRYYDQATRMLQEITQPTISLAVSNVFLPESETLFQLNSRNLETIHFNLFQIDLVDSVMLHLQRQQVNWIDTIATVGRNPIRTWTRTLENTGDYRPLSTQLRLGTLAAGAYLLTASGGGVEARDLVLVSQGSLVLKTLGDRTLLYFCSVFDGSPIAGADFSVWRYSNRNDIWEVQRGTTDENGIATTTFDHETNSSHTFFAAASGGVDQAFSQGQGYSPRRSPWRVYVLTDRPAYRPGETAHWKLVARRESEEGYLTPSEEEIEVEIRDAKGARVHKGSVTLNRFGSAWGSLDLTSEMALGEYRISFWDAGRKNSIGSETLLRLEEYKLPEFKVSVETPSEDGQARVFRLGDEVEVKIRAAYYFGSPVVGADAEIIVYQRPFYHYWRPPGEFSWLQDDSYAVSRSYGGWRGQEIRRVTLKTDDTGEASLSIDSSAFGLQDVELEVEARVRDSSRREVVATDTVRVTRQSYFAYLQPEHQIYQPGDTVGIDVHALDANQQPVQVEGSVTVVRNRWTEIWTDPLGKEISQEALRARRESSQEHFPPPGWSLTFRGYREEKILTRRLKTDAEGKAELSFEAAREGYFQIRWVGEREADFPVQAQTQVWVGDRTSTELGYRHSGLDIVVDQETVRPGQPLAVMLASETSNRWVLVSLEAEHLYTYRLVHLEGTVKLLHFDIGDEYVPNVFLKGIMVSDLEIFEDTEQLIVPPTRNMIQVELSAEQGEFLPRSRATLHVTTRDEEGQPVAAEVTLGVVDDSVYAIQQDYSTDPLRFFFGRKRPLSVQTQSTFQQRRYSHLKEDAEGNLVLAGQRRDEDRLNGVDALQSVDVLGGSRSESFAMADNAEMEMAQSMPMSARGNLREIRAMEEGAAVGLARKSAAATGEAGPVQVRTDFSTTIVWEPDAVTDEKGRAEVVVPFNDMLTAWRATARATSAGDDFGQGTTTLITNQPLIVRLQAPRFFQVGDRVTVAAIVNNRSGEDLEARVDLQGSGLHDLETATTRNVSVKAGGDGRVEWDFLVREAGEARLKVVARAGRHSDAMEKVYPVFEHGIEKLIAFSGKSRQDLLDLELTLPERKPDSTRVVVQVTPSLAVTMLDALPYLVYYPYGCTEQTMSRFLPAAITARTLSSLGLKGEDIAGKMFGGIEAETASQTHPKKPEDLSLLDDVVERGLSRLYDFQHGDGGWGWWKDGESDHFMSAYVLWGLSIALKGELDVRGDVMQRAANFLDKEIVEAELQPDLQAWMLHALSAYRSVTRTSPSSFQVNAFNTLWNGRDRLNAYTRALLALSAHQMNNRERAETLIENLENGVKRDLAPQQSILTPDSKGRTSGLATAHWGEDGIRYRWSEGGVEATAFALRALLQIKPEHELIEPVINWLIKNRRGAQWSSTRDTAIVVLALNDYLQTSQELSQPVAFQVRVNGRKIAERKLSGLDLLSAPSRFEIPAALIADRSTIEIQRTSGQAPLYYMVEARFFSLEEPIAAEGYEIFTRREYLRLVPEPTLLKGHVLEEVPLLDGGIIKTGERMEVVLRIEAKNNYEYLVFEDLKPAGLESVALQSGGPVYARELKRNALEEEKRTSAGGKGESLTTRPVPPRDDNGRFTGRSRWVHRELRDRKVAFFIDKLPEGVWEIRYELRAETPGAFHALPTLGFAMYVPEIRTNSDEIRVNVADE